MKITNATTIPYQNLANAIVLQAANDYRKSLRDDDLRLMYECEKFFHSHWYLILTKLDGDVLIEKLRKELSDEQRTPSKHF